MEPRSAISTFTARYVRYISVRQVVGTRTARYRAVPSKIDRRQSIEREKGKKKRKKKKKKGKRIPIARARSSPVRYRRLRAIAARGSPAPTSRYRSWVAGAFTPARGERSRR
ncbi:hypothetical protein GW17_00059585, partial [Ensete ventricosum]